MVVKCEQVNFSMNLFLEQKTTPLKFKLAKLFAIFLVCFFVGGIARTTMAQGPSVGSMDAYEPKPTAAQTNNKVPLPGPGQLTAAAELRQTMSGWGPDIKATSEATIVTFKAPNENNTVYKVITVSDVGMLSSENVSRYTYKIDPATGKGTLVPNFSEEKMPSQATYLELDPTALPKDGVVGYDYKLGVYTYTDANGNKIELSPDNITADLNKLMSEEGNPEQAKKILNAIQKTNMASSNEATVKAKNQAATGDANNSSRPDMSCEIWKGELMCVLAKTVYYITIKPASWLLVASGWLLDSVFMKTVVNLKATLKPAGDNSGFYGVIRLVWGIFRDLINMSFIFILLFASIKTILLADTTGLKKTITNIVIVALLMNFSLFFVELAIDVSNNLAVTIYNSINQGSGHGNNLAAAFMKNLSLETLMGDAWNQGAGASKDFTGMITICIFGSVFILVLAVVFFVMAILFVVRFIEFIILMMMSPIGIGSIAIPKLASAFPGGNYWTNLLSQCFFAPIMFIFLWISIKMLDVLAPLTGAVGTSKLPISGMMTNGQLAAGYLGGYILGFTVIIFILIKGMEYAKSLSAKGASGAQAGFLKYSGANWAQNKMQNAPRAIGARTLNATAGRSLNAITNSRIGKAIGSTRLGNVLYNQANRGGESWRNAVDQRAKRETARAELRTAAATQRETRNLAEQQNIQADLNILSASEILSAGGQREVALAERNVARGALTNSHGAAGTAVVINRAAVEFRDLEHAQEIRTQINEDLQTTERDIANFDSQIRRINEAITAGTATAADRASLPTLQAQRNNSERDRTAQRENLRRLTELTRPLQRTQQGLDRIDTNLRNLYSGFNPDALDESTAAINRMATSVRENGHKSIRNIAGPAVATVAGGAVRTNETATQYHNRTVVNPQIQNLQSQVQNTQTEHSRQNATGQITNGILPGFGLNQAGREAAAREYRQRYSNRNGGNR